MSKRNTLTLLIIITLVLGIIFILNTRKNDMSTPNFFATTSSKTAETPESLLSKRSALIASLKKSTFNPAYFGKYKNDAYHLSVPLMVTAILGERTLYKKIRSDMLATSNIQHAINGNFNGIPKEKLTFTAWMLGRLTMAAAILGDRQASDAMAKHLNKLQAYNLEIFPTPDVNTYWVFQYLAISTDNRKNYKNYTKHIFNVSDVINNITKTSTKRDRSKAQNQQAIKSDIEWVWVTQLLAGATKHDQFTYDLSKALVTNGQNSLVNGIANNISEGDYPTWVYSYAQYSAALMGDEKLYKTAENRVQSYLDAGQYPVNRKPLNPLDVALAKANEWRAEVRHAGLKINYPTETGAKLTLEKIVQSTASSPSTSKS